MKKWLFGPFFSLLVFALVAIGVRANGVMQPSIDTYKLSLLTIDTGDPPEVSPAASFESGSMIYEIYIQPPGLLYEICLLAPTQDQLIDYGSGNPQEGAKVTVVTAYQNPEAGWRS